MYCTNCGTKVEKGNFCPQCGTPINRQQSSISLPHGVIQDDNGVIRWAWKERGYTNYYFMDQNRIGYRCVHDQKDDTLGNAFRELAKSSMDLAASNVIMDSEGYTGQDMPWEPNGEGIGSTYLTFSFIKKVKRNPKKSEIMLKENISSMTVRMTAEQYPYIEERIIRHVNGAAVK